MISLRSGLITSLLVMGFTPPVIAAPKAASTAKVSGAPKGNVTRAQMQAETKRIFDVADTDKNGLMDQAEFRRRMGAVLNRTPPGTPGAPTKEAAQKLLAAADAAFRSVDSNGDGKLSLKEASTRPMKAFDMMDTNHDGVLTTAEKRATLAQSAAAAPAKAGTPVGKLPPGR